MTASHNDSRTLPGQGLHGDQAGNAGCHSLRAVLIGLLAWGLGACAERESGWEVAGVLVPVASPLPRAGEQDLPLPAGDVSGTPTVCRCAIDERAFFREHGFTLPTSQGSTGGGEREVDAEIIQELVAVDHLLQWHRHATSAPPSAAAKTALSGLERALRTLALASQRLGSSATVVSAGDGDDARQRRLREAWRGIDDAMPTLPRGTAIAPGGLAASLTRLAQVVALRDGLQLEPCLQQVEQQLRMERESTSPVVSIEALGRLAQAVAQVQEQWRRNQAQVIDQAQPPTLVYAPATSGP